MRTIKTVITGFLSAGIGCGAVSGAAAQTTDLQADTVAADPVAAEGTPPPANEAQKVEGIGEVVVTARRVAESLQEVPIAISALSADALVREQINSPQDLQGRVPSLVVGSNAQMRNTETPTIRGQGAQFSASPGVIIYFGEVPLPSDPVANNQGGPGKFFDLANVQILKGSQGTLFGRNTTGGALLLEPHKPDEEFSASLRAEGTSYSGTGYEGMVNVPLIGESLLMRAGFKYFDRDGFTHDVVSGTDYDSKHFSTSRLGLTWRPAEGVENYLLGYYTDSKDNGTGTVIEDINREGLNQGLAAAIGLDVLSQIPGIPLDQTANVGCLVLNFFGPSTNCGQDILDEQHARDHRHVQLSGDPNDILRTGAAIDQLSFDLADNLKLRNIASYSHFKHHYRWDLDGSRAKFVDFNNADDQFQADLDTITEELQFQGSVLDERLKYVVGGYYEHTKVDGYAQATALFVQSVLTTHSQKKDSYASFVQGTYDLGGWSDALEGLSLTAGARYTIDEMTGEALNLQRALDTFTLTNIAYDVDLKDHAITYTLGLDYKFDDNLVYGKVSRGYKAGGMAPVSVHPDHHVYDPEFVLNYEIGQKSDFTVGGMPARVNASVYYTDYTDLQKGATDTYLPENSVNLTPQVGDTVFNVGKASIVGFEVEGTLRPLPSLTLLATYGYTKAKYKKFDLLIGDVTPHLDCSGEQIESGSVAELSCVPYQAVPKNQFSVSGIYLLPLDASVGEVEGSLTYAWTDRQYGAQTTLPAAEPGAWLASYGLLNASLRWTNILGSAFDLQLYGTNLTDEEYRLSNSSVWNLTYFRASIYSEPRIVGLQIGYHWD